MQARDDSNGKAETKKPEYTVIPNECKIYFILFSTLWILASLWSITVSYPVKIVKIVEEKITAHPFWRDLIVLIFNIAPTVVIQSYLVLPLAIKLLRFWIFDTLIDLDALKAIHSIKDNTDSMDTVVSISREHDEEENDQRTKITHSERRAITVSNVHKVTVPIRCESKSSKNTFGFGQILKFGIFPVPDAVFLDPIKYRPTPSKWRFTMLITATIVLVEFILWLTLYKWVFEKWDITNITNPDLEIDIRIRTVVFLLCDLSISLPILYYLVNPFIVNRLIPQWMYQRRDDTSRCIDWLDSGFAVFEDIKIKQLIGYRMVDRMFCEF